jgi:hypothetical protein
MKNASARECNEYGATRVKTGITQGAWSNLSAGSSRGIPIKGISGVRGPLRNPIAFGIVVVIWAFILTAAWSMRSAEAISDAKKPLSNIAISTNADHVIFGSRLADAYTLGQNTSEQLANWVTRLEDYASMRYASGQKWGVVFISVGTPGTSIRQTVDLSGFDTISVELRGKVGGEFLEIGVKDAADPSDGSESRVLVANLTTQWKRFDFPLADFLSADLTRLHVVIEFVFVNQAMTVDFRNIRYLTRASAKQ